MPKEDWQKKCPRTPLRQEPTIYQGVHAFNTSVRYISGHAGGHLPSDGRISGAESRRARWVGRVPGGDGRTGSAGWSGVRR
ncbi:MAG: hypothetical protein ACSLFC_07910 [Desulfuromonadales bacterium]